MTDESRLRDSVTDETPDDYKQRFRAHYGFDLDEIGGTRIVDVLARIADARRPPDTVH